MYNVYYYENTQSKEKKSLKQERKKIILKEIKYLEQTSHK